jgi:hypothetical protein
MARELSESFTVNEGVDHYGVHTSLIFQGDEVVKRRTFDAEPYLQAAQEDRTATAGQRWGEMRKVGSIPMAVYAEVLKIQDQRERQKYVLGWLRQNPAMVSFDKFLKRG